MEREVGKHKRQSPGPEAGRSAKVVADLPEDAEMRDKLEERKNRDGHPGSCGV